MSLSLRYAARSHVGLIRDHNEDSGYAGPRLLVVADGMGGQAAGEVASSVVLRTIAQLDTPTLPELPADPVRALADQVFAAHEQLRVIVAQNPQLEGMGTTLTAFLLAERHLAFAHIGDSRAYRLRGGRLEQLTSDHTWVQRLVDEGRISEEEAGHHPQRSLLMRALDGRGQAEPDLSVTDAIPGDRLMLCSDGLSGVVSFETMEAALTECPDPHQASETLVQLALRGGGPDNITCIVADVLDEGYHTQGGVHSAATQYIAMPTTVGAAADAGPGGVPLYGPAGGGPQQPGPPPSPHNHLSVPSDDLAPDTPAGRAARMRREPRGPGDQTSTTAEMAAVEPEDRPGRRWVKPVAGLAVAVVLLGGAAAGGYIWSQKQYYVAVSDGQVAIYQGVNYSVGGFHLSHVVSTSPQVTVAGLPIPSQTRVTAAINAASLSDARSIVATLGTLEAGCAELTAVPTATPTLAPTATPTPSITPSADPGGPTTAAGHSATKTPTPGHTSPTATPSQTPTTVTPATTSPGTAALNGIAAQCPASSGN